MISQKVKYGSALHERIKTAICERKKLSETKMRDFHKQWDSADDSMRAYIHERDVDALRKANKELAGETDFVTLEIPYVYAIVMTAHTYYSSVMLSRAPVWQFTARHGETQESVSAVEAVQDYQLKNGTQLPVMYNWIYDLARYSLGVVGTYWDKEEKIICRYERVPNSLFGIPLAGEKVQKIEERLLGYEGNKLFNVRPYDFFPDPRVPIWRFQDGEFVCRDTSEGYYELLAAEHTNKGSYVNLDKLQDVIKTRGGDWTQGSPRVQMPLQPGEEGGTAPGPGFARITDAYIKLVPSLWGLGDSQRVETWNFQLAEKEVVISAQPLGAYHNQFPFAVMEGNFGSDEFAKFGMIEVIRPLTDVLTWLFNSHFYNVRRVLNNQLVVDPSMLVMKDLTKPGQRVIRLKPQAYGRDVRSLVHQLQHTDVTRQHLSDAQYVEQMIQRVSAVVNNVMGMTEQGGRRSATESRQNVGYATSRLRTPVEYNSSLALSPLSQMLVSNTQQYMSAERKYAVAGNTLETAMRFIQATPDLIAGAFDFVPVDGTMPIDRLAQANFWKELLMQMARVPQLVAEWDISGMIGHLMKMQGERNIDKFKRVNMQVAPQGADLGNEARKGNLVPVGGANGRGNGAVAPGSSGGTV